MKIGFDAKRAFLNQSGLGNYSRTLIKSLAHYYPGNKYLLFTPKMGDNYFTEYVNRQNNISVISPKNLLDRFFRSYWRSYGITKLLSEENVDLYHGLSNELPFNIGEFQGRKIVT